MHNNGVYVIYYVAGCENSGITGVVINYNWSKFGETVDVAPNVARNFNAIRTVSRATKVQFSQAPYVPGVPAAIVP